MHAALERHTPHSADRGACSDTTTGCGLRASSTSSPSPDPDLVKLLQPRVARAVVVLVSAVWGRLRVSKSAGCGRGATPSPPQFRLSSPGADALGSAAATRISEASMGGGRGRSDCAGSFENFFVALAKAT